MAVIEGFRCDCNSSRLDAKAYTPERRSRFHEHECQMLSSHSQHRQAAAVSV